MKRSQAFPGTFLGKDDVLAPIVATIRDVASEQVQCEHGPQDKPVMHFAHDPSSPGLKPLILNDTNWTACETAYGQESDDWRGKVVEIYVDPNVMFGKRRVGGVRLRIPSGPAPSQPIRPAPPATEPTSAQKVAQTIRAMDHAQTKDNLDAWAKWGKGIGSLTQDLRDAMEDAYAINLERLQATAKAKRPLATA